ncbi:DUF4349 domain-containing protein [bacterium]|nr:DUF4349 domain-containing protein [bacterium]
MKTLLSLTLLVLLLPLSLGAQESSTEEYRRFEANLVIVVEEFESAGERAKTLLDPADGYLQNVETHRDEDKPDELYLEYSIAAAKIDGYLDKILALGEVLVEDSQGSVITETIVMLEERVNGLEADLEELRELADASGLSTDIRIERQRELARAEREFTREQEKLLKLLDSTRQYTVELTLVESIEGEIVLLERILFTFVLPGLALLVAAFFLGRLLGRQQAKRSK